MAYEQKIREFALDLYKIDAVKFGEFKTKVGLMTPIYCDLRVIISHPKLLENLSSLIVEYIQKLDKFDVICGVPYTALPIATCVCTKTSTPMLMRRKELKDYGTKKLIEGQYKEGDRCLIVEDVVTSGSSILETAKDLVSAGLQCSDAIVVLNREQGGADILENNKIKMHALLNMSQLLAILREAGCINDDTVKTVERYLKNVKVDASVIEKTGKLNRLVLKYEDRIKHSNSIAGKLLNIMASKKSNLCVAADLPSATDILNLAESVGPHICALKTHVDIIEDFHENFIKHLKTIAERHNFMLFEDRKYADIGETVRLQYTAGVFKVASWAKLVTAHSLMGKGVLDALNRCPEEKGVFLLAETSAAGSLISDTYTKETVKLAVEYPQLVVGVVCQSPLFLDQPGLLQLTPGVKIDETEDSLGQRYDCPESVIIDRGGDIAVVGRGVTKAADQEKAAIEYKMLLWKAYMKRTKST